MMICIHCYSQVGCISLTEILIWQIKLWQLCTSIRHFQPGHRYLRIRRLITHYRKIQHYISMINPFGGKIFLAFLAINVPINCYFILNVILQVGDRYSLAIQSIMAMQQLHNIMVVHYMIAQNNQKLVALGKQMMAIPFHFKLTRTSRFKLNLFIETTYTKKRHGITYWKFGLVSLKSFVQVSLLPMGLVVNLFLCSF